MMSESLTLWNNVCVLSRGDRINILAETHRTATRRRPEPNENRAQQVSHRQEPEEVFQFLLQFLILGQYQTSKVILRALMFEFMPCFQIDHKCVSKSSDSC